MKYNIKKCLVLAPHLLYPTRNGADILIDRRWCEFSHYVDSVDIVANNCVIHYVKGKRKSEINFSNSMRSKLHASIRCVLFHSHYLVEKFNAVSYTGIAKKYLDCTSYDVVICSFISSASLVDLNKNRNALYCIETHNDEIKWFDDMRLNSKNILIKLVAWLSGEWVIKFFHKHESQYLFLHVASTDELGYKVYYPNHLSYIAPVGCEENQNNLEHISLVKGSPIKLLFVGSLSVKMNYDAICNFAEKYYPLLSKCLLDGIDVRIVGSNPSSRVINICSLNGWDLCPDVSDEELIGCFAWADFSILPFAYSTGGKLKLLKSLSLGVPFLATNSVAGQIDEICPPSLISDDPEEWLSQIRLFQLRGITLEQRNKLKISANKYSWRNIAFNLYEHLCSINAPQELTNN